MIVPVFFVCVCVCVRACPLPLPPTDMLLLASVCRECGDGEASVHWLTAASLVLTSHPFPWFNQNCSVYGHLFQQCFEQRAVPAAIAVCERLQEYVITHKGEHSPELRWVRSGCVSASVCV